MILGILSDTHGRHGAARRALELLRQHRATYFIHCGDVGGEDIVDLLAAAMLEASSEDSNAGAAFVFGNNDLDREALARYARSIGVEACGDFGTVTLQSKHIAIAHGDIGSIVRRVLDGQKHDYLLVGHSHVRGDERVRGVRVINPGALHRVAKKSVATLDLSRDRLTFLEVD